jgi:hypothetical protein
MMYMEKEWLKIGRREVGFQAVSHVRRQCTEVPTLYQDAIDATRMHICDGDAARAVLVAGWVGVTSI